ncbi:MAG: Spx/MgsR family RNA polymerase-binding regulatory protein [Amphiplicatus sp.]
MPGLNFYGLKTCDTCRKALKALAANGADVLYHDLRAEGVSKKRIETWAKAVGWESLLNKSSMTWRGLDDEDKADVDEKKAIALMTDNPTLIKRPIIEKGPTEVYVGWGDDVRNKVL